MVYMNTDTDTRTKVFKVLGTTDHVTVCFLCGREELRGTVALEILDADGTGTGTIVYYGSSCGAKAAGWTQKDFKAAVKTADAEKAEARRIAREEETHRYCTARDAWSMQTYGCDIWSVRDDNGKRRSYFDIVKEFDAAVAAGEASI